MGLEKENMNELLEKLQTNSLHEHEKLWLRKYIQDSYNDRSLNELMQKHWQQLEAPNEGTEHSLEHVKLKLWALTEEVYDETKIPHAHNFDLKKYVARAVAVLLLPLLVYTTFLQLKVNTQQELVIQKVVAHPGTRTHFFLPDSSEVWLNSESSLEFPAQFIVGDERNVKLRGQGYFKVRHNKKQPFIVDLTKMKVAVLGTSFDVRNYEEDGQIVSTLEEGSIAILDSHKKEVARLTPGQQATLTTTTLKLLVEQVDTRLSTSWKDGVLIFRNAHLTEVVSKLERWFNCNIHVTAALKNSNIEYNATIKNETLVEVLQMMEISTGIETEIEEREVYISLK